MRTDASNPYVVMTMKAFRDYCKTGEDKPTWKEWQEQMKKMSTANPVPKMIAFSIRHAVVNGAFKK